MPDRDELLNQAEAAILRAVELVRAARVGQPPVSVSSSPTVVSVAPVGPLANPKGFFDHMRASSFMGPTLSSNEVTGCGAILDACYATNFPISWTAYALATAFHETAGTMQPIREYGRGKGRKYGTPGPHGGQVAYGRGYVQLTWADNYKKMDDRLKLSGRLLANYDLALDPDIAAKIMLVGMTEGLFTGKKLADTLPAEGQAMRTQFTASRAIINGKDKDVLIAGYAMTFQEALVIGQWV